MISQLFETKDKCCGCGLCANMCPTGTIVMEPDEQGFLYPSIKEEAMCISCGKCINVCPIKNVQKQTSQFTDYYAGSFAENEETISCASGGAATAISSGFLRAGGVVYGAAYSDDWKDILYLRADKPQDLERLKGSKYAQADKGMTYQSIQKDLKQGIDVLFIGLPCDVAAVKGVFEKYPNLYTAELICHGPTSAKVHQQYCDDIEKTMGGTLDFFSCRYKNRGQWKPFYIFARTKNGKKHLVKFHSSSYGAAFRYLKRPSCYACPIKGNALRGDLMLGDYHYVEEGMKGYNPHGVSSILVHNQQGEKLLSLLGSEFHLTPIQQRGAEANRAIFHPISAPENADAFVQTFIKEGLAKAGRLPMVRASNMKRFVKEKVMKCGVKVKRLLLPSSRPSDL